MTQLLQNVVYGTVMILAVAVLRGTLKDRLLPEARLALWAVCLFRLFTPAAPASALSFWGLFGRGAREIPVSELVLGPVAAPNAEAFTPAAPVGPAPVTLAAPAETGTGVPWGAILAAVWIAVGVILAVRYALAYVRTRRAVGRAIPLGREDARYSALPKCARLREGPMEGAPLTFGVARPTVVLTPGLDGAELACVLAHEGVHARRRDNLWHYAAAVALTVFWWDPAVWLMARLIQRDVELSCDQAAVRRLGEGKRAEYANALVTLSTQAEGGAFCHGFGPKRTEERIISVMKYKKATVAGIALTLALVLAVTVGFASNPAKDVPDEEGATSSTPSPAMWIASFGPEGEMLSLNIGLDYLEELLAGYAADGSIAEEGAADFLAEAKAASRDGVMVRWDFPENSGLYTDRGSHEEPGPNIYCMDENGNKVYLSLVEMLAAFPFPSPAYAFTSDEYAGAPKAEAGNPDTNADDQDETHICTREDCPIQPSVHFHNEDGSVSYIFNDLFSYVDETETDSQDGMFVCAQGVPPLCTQEDCDVSGPHWHENGEVVHYYNTLPAALDLPEMDIDQSGYTWVELEKFYMTPDEYVAKVEEHRAELQAAVDKGLITREYMNLAIAFAVGEIERVRSGEVVPSYVEWGEERQDGLTFTFGYESADYVGCLGVMERVPIDQGHGHHSDGHHSSGHH